MKIKEAIAALAGASFTLGAAPAFAQQDALVVILDRSGSMSQSGNSAGQSKWSIALDGASDAVSAAAPNRAYEVWTFSGSSYTRHFSFADGAALTTTARQSEILNNVLPSLPGPGATTPLALTVCDAVDSLTSWATGIPGFPPPLLRIALFSDGLENSTPSGTQCAGPDSTTTYDPTNPNRGGLTPNSWEWKVLNKAITGNANNPANTPVTVIADVTTLFNFIPTFSVGTSSFNSSQHLRVSQTSYEVAPTGRIIAVSPQSASSGFEFFDGLARETGGKYVEIDPSQPPPVLGDIDGSGCVDNADYFALLAVYGQPVNGSNVDADLNRNQVVDYSDYLTLLQNFGSGTCP